MSWNRRAMYNVDQPVVKSYFQTKLKPQYQSMHKIRCR